MKPTLNIVIYFCLLSMLGCGSKDTNQDNESITIVQDPDLTLEKLLTDSELVTPDLPYALSSNPKYNTWIKENHYPIRSITFDEDFSDLSFLENLLADKKIVQLGESTHGSAEFNHMKVRLIKYLHQELGFDVISFESSLQGCHMGNKNMSSYTRGVKCIFAVWSTQEVEELFRYIKITQESERPLILAGVDIQKTSQLDSSESYKSYLSPFIVDMTEEDKGFITNLLDEIFTFSDFYRQCYADQYSQSSDNCLYIANNYLLLKDRAAQAYSMMSMINETEFMENNSLVDVKIAKRLFWSMQYYVEHLYQIASSVPAQEWIRDEGMGRNATFLMEDVYPEKKMIIWAHNSHIAYNYSNQAADHEGVNRMGMVLKETWQEQLYTIGFVMIRGSSNGINGPVPVSQHSPDSFESIIYSLRKAAVFVPLSNTDLTTENDDWQHQLINIQYWGNVTVQQVLGSTYDAMIVIDKSNPSKHVNY